LTIFKQIFLYLNKEKIKALTTIKKQFQFYSTILQNPLQFSPLTLGAGHQQTIIHVAQKVHRKHVLHLDPAQVRAHHRDPGAVGELIRANFYDNVDDHILLLF
jgi:hypothetical protein